MQRFQLLSPHRKISLFSFFAGAGFLDLGFEHSGFDICYVNEFHLPFLEAYQHSRRVLGLDSPRFGFDSASIEAIDNDFLASAMVELKRDLNVIGFIGGPPCPDFSIGGKNRGKDGENGRLSNVYVDLVCLHKPDFFLFENVKGLYRTQKHRDFFEKLKRKLRRNGYLLHERLINSIEYGAPQDRERIILMGFLDRSLSKRFLWNNRIYESEAVLAQPWPVSDLDLPGKSGGTFC